jgi:hypothetical protein
MVTELAEEVEKIRCTFLGGGYMIDDRNLRKDETALAAKSSVSLQAASIVLIIALVCQSKVVMTREETHAKVIGNGKHGIEALKEIVQDIGILIVNFLGDASPFTDGINRLRQVETLDGKFGGVRNQRPI